MSKKGEKQRDNIPIPSSDKPSIVGFFSSRHFGSLGWWFFGGLALIVLLAASFVYLSGFTKALPTCGDGSFYDTCSLDKPYYCDGPYLVKNSSECGCPKTLDMVGADCSSQNMALPKEIFLNYTLEGKQKNLDFVVYGGLVDYLSGLPDFISYDNGEKPLRVDFKLRNINEENQKDLLIPLVKEIENLAPNNKVKQARIAVSLVQNIEWGRKNETIIFAGTKVDYSRYPYEVLYDSEGLCGEKSELLVFLLRELGYGTAIFYYPEENHEAVGIKCPVEESVERSGYCFIETSGPSIISDDGIEYSKGQQLESYPEIVLISEGIGLPSGLYEYRDAEILKKIRKRDWANPISSYRIRNLKEKYGLAEEYNLD